MSNDNGVYLLKTTDWFKKQAEEKQVDCLPDGIIAYRVAHVEGGDNFYYIEQAEVHNLGIWMLNWFDKSPVFYSEKEAMDYAIRTHKNIGVTERGIIGIDASKYNFPGS
jgi:hypothetical protein